MRLLEALISALMVAGLYATMSYGLALIYGVMKIINLANAGSMMLASFTTFFLWQTFGLDPLFAVIVVAPLFFVIGALIEVGLVRRARHGGVPVRPLDPLRRAPAEELHDHRARRAGIDPRRRGGVVRPRGGRESHRHRLEAAAREPRVVHPPGRRPGRDARRDRR